MKHIIIVDCQEDFCNPKGALYVKGAEVAVENIKKYLESLKDEKDIVNVVFTVDWHPLTHCSFKENGGQWPVHCVKDTKGSNIVEPLIRAACSINEYPEIIKKGSNEDEEEYGAFAHFNRILPNGEIEFAVDGDNFDYTSFYRKDDELIICGVAGDYCVYETYKNLKCLGMNITPYYDGIAFIGEKFDFEEKFKAEEE
jgi:nicotinamidase-related amidase